MVIDGDRGERRGAHSAVLRGAEAIGHALAWGNRALGYAGHALVALDVVMKR
jgi:hypothetical protein